MDVYERGPVKLVLADCLEWLPTIANQSGFDCKHLDSSKLGDAAQLDDMNQLYSQHSFVSSVVTDPPYGVNLGARGVGGNWRSHAGHGLTKGAYESYDDTYENYCAVVAPAIRICVDRFRRVATFVGPHIHELPKHDAIGGVYCSAASGRHRWGFNNLLTVLFYGSAAGLQNGAKYPCVIASNATSEPSGHPCPKPVEWMEWLVNLASLEGETVCDPFAGSGTTAIACIRTGRRFIGCEIERKYFDIACARIDRELNQKRLFDKPAPKEVQRELMLSECSEKPL